MNVGDIIEDSIRGWYLRVITSTPDYVHLMPIGIKGQWVIRQSFKHVNAMLSTNVWKVNPAYTALTEDSTEVTTIPGSSRKSRERGDKLFLRLATAFEDIDSLMTSEGRAKTYREQKKHDTRLSKQTYYAALRRWLEGGLTIASLDARWKSPSARVNLAEIEEVDLHCAKRNVQEKSRSLQKLGAPDSSPKEATKNGHSRRRASPFKPTRYLMDRDTARVFLEYYKKKKKPECGSLNDLYGAVHRDIFSTPQPYGPPLLWPSWSIPSFAQFSYYWRRLYNHEHRARFLHGAHTFELNSRSFLGQQISEAYAAGRIGQLDATVWNVNLVGDEPGAPLIGPPVVFRIRCLDTGQLLGISISLENASFYSAGMAIANCLEDKETYCRSLDVYIPGLPWEVSGLPAQIDADQGETYNKKPRAFIRLTGTSITNMLAARGEMKGGVESDFNTIQVRLSPMTPGAIIKKFEDEHGIKWHMKASMRVRDFARMLLLEELKKMHLPREGVQRPMGMHGDQYSTASHDMFQWSVRNGGGALRKFDSRLVRLSLLPREKASIDEYGIFFNGVHFACNVFQATAATVQARAKGREKVNVAYDPLLAATIWLIVGDTLSPTQYIACKLSDKFAFQRGFETLTWREIAIRMNSTTRTNVWAREGVNEAMEEAIRLQHQIISHANSKTRDDRKLRLVSENKLLKEKPKARARAKEQQAPLVALSAPIQPIEEAPIRLIVGLHRESGVAVSQLEKLSTSPMGRSHVTKATAEDEAADEFSKLLDYCQPASTRIPGWEAE